MRHLAPAAAPAVAVGVLAALALVAVRVPQPPAGEPPRVRLAVLVVFDQLRGDYPERWKPLFGKGGFARLLADGAHFAECHYPYAGTFTGPGHASILSGTCPDRHGIVTNEWYERGETAYCAGSLRYEFVPPAPKSTDPKAKPTAAGNPDRLLAETVADVLRERHPSAKIFGLSLKDRSAILPTGKRSNGAYWFNGQFVTSTYYDDRLHDWAEEFNRSKFADQWFGAKWEKLRGDIDYAAWSGPDDAPGEGKGTGQGVTFPHPMNGGKTAIGKDYYSALANSPFGNELLLEFAKKCVVAEGLGKDDVPDLLVVSFSSNDLVGHTWGPDSQEVLDVTLRSDVLMAELLALLDTEVGRDRYLLAITADHGVCPLVEASQARGRAARRVNVAALRNDLEKHLAATLGTPGASGAKPEEKPDKDSEGMEVKKSGWVETVHWPWVHINPKAASAVGKTVPEVARIAVDFLGRHPDVGRALTRADITTAPASDGVAALVRRSTWVPPAGRAERCGDVYIILPDYSVSTNTTNTGTTHGSPYAYDRHVPLLVYGPGIAGGTRTEPTTPQATAAIFSHYLGLRLPNKADFPLPATLEVKP
jgi:predicted AlkP superfamily pyrophosphatase or phosphodiesterase